jgi:uncharacterized protein YxjI
MSKLQFPITITFKIGTISNDFFATDAQGSVIAFVRQKLFKLIDHVEVFSDELRTKKLYDIKANKWIDFSATYTFFDIERNKIGSVGRKGLQSIWKASYHIMDKNDNLLFEVNEENAWVKVLDGILDRIPGLSMLSGYLFNPTYLITNSQGSHSMRIKKQPSLFGRRFVINKLQDIDEDQETSMLLGAMMMLVLERQRG